MDWTGLGGPFGWTWLDLAWLRWAGLGLSLTRLLTWLTLARLGYDWIGSAQLCSAGISGLGLALALELSIEQQQQNVDWHSG